MCSSCAAPGWDPGVQRQEGDGQVWGFLRDSCCCSLPKLSFYFGKEQCSPAHFPGNLEKFCEDKQSCRGTLSGQKCRPVLPAEPGTAVQFAGTLLNFGGY